MGPAYPADHGKPRGLGSFHVGRKVRSGFGLSAGSGSISDWARLTAAGSRNLHLPKIRNLPDRSTDRPADSAFIRSLSGVEVSETTARMRRRLASILPLVVSPVFLSVIENHRRLREF